MQAQASMEYILITAVGLAILLPIVYLVFSETSLQTDQVAVAEMQSTGNEIVKNAEQIYYLGPPSKVTIPVKMPKGVSNISIRNNESRGIHELLFTLAFAGKKTEMVFTPAVRMEGSFSGRSFTQGARVVTLEARDDGTPYVWMNIT